MKNNQQHITAISISDTGGPDVFVRGLLVHTLMSVYIRGTALLSLSILSLLFLVTGHTAQHSDTGLSEVSACSAQNIQQQQENAPGQLIKKTVYSVSEPSTGQIARQYRYKIIRRFPHNTTAFTQGLVFYEHYLYEGTGLLGKSEIRRLDINTGELLKAKKTDIHTFGEGIGIKKNQLVQLSWKSERAYIYDVQTFALLKEIEFAGEGWGVTYINDKMLTSNGSSLLKWHDVTAVKNAAIKNTEIRVTESGVEVQGINELEYANGFVYANIWPTDCIAEIDPSTGNIRGWINLAGLYPASLRTDWNAVLNGIAYQPDKNVFYVTGKFWPYIYVISLQLAENSAQGKA